MLDVEKAFDSVWHAGLRYKLAHGDLPCKIVRLLSSFLDDRKIKVKVNGDTSEYVSLKAGTPQGSVISPLLFLIYVNDVPVKQKHNTDMSQFADDMCMWTSYSHAKIVEKRLNGVLRDLEQWCSMWRIKLNAGKTQLILFTRRKKQIELNITLFGERIESCQEASLLGITVDRKLLFKTHVANMTGKARKRLGLLASLRGTTWGADSKSLLRLYKSYVRPILEYGAVLIAASKKTRLLELQIVQNRALRIALRMPMHTSINRLHELANMPSIKQRLKILGQKTITRLKTSYLFEQLSEKREILRKGHKTTTLDSYQY